HYLWEKYAASHRLRFISVPFEGVVAEILQNVDNSQMGVVLKRMMLRAASRIAHRYGYHALVTGEAIAQVSSQTLPNLAAIDQVCDMLVLRPLITTSKTEIIRTARRIGTEAFSSSMPEYCGVISVSPDIHTTVRKVEAAETGFDFSVLDAAVEQATSIDCCDLGLELEGSQVETVEQALAGQVVMDCSAPDGEGRKAVEVGGVEALR